MKFGAFKSVGHNIADSAACGLGFMIGLYTMNIFLEASESPEGYIEVDFLTGATSGGTPKASLARALRLYSEDALPRLCSQHGVSVSDFRELRVRFWEDRATNTSKSQWKIGKVAETSQSMRDFRGDERELLDRPPASMDVRYGS